MKATVPTIRVWEGVYQSFAEAPVHGNGHASQRWLDRSKSCLEEWRRQSPTSHEYLLPAIVAAMAVRERPVRILDFGGSLGASFVPLVRALADDVRVEFHIIDLPEICRLGVEQFAGDPRVRFHDTLPELSGDLDIVHAGSSLHYLEDWRAISGALADYGAQVVLLSNVPVGEFSSFVTIQNFYESKMPVWFWNFEEFVATWRGLGYGLRLKTSYIGTYLGKTGPLPMDNMPPQNRLDHTSHLLLGRI